MTAASATPARAGQPGAGRAVAGESPCNISYANGIPSENAGQLLVNHGNRIYNMDRCLTPLKAKDPLSACNAAGPSNQPWRSSPMDGLRYLTYLITFSAIWIPPILRIERDIATSGGVL